MVSDNASPPQRTARRPMTVLGVDPGLTRCGIGVVAGPSSRPVATYHGCVQTSPDTPLELRLLAVHDAIMAAIETYRPDAVAVERVLFSVNVRSAMATGQAAGIALLAGARSGLPVTSYSPNEVKETVTGDGAAAKDAVGRLVAAQLGLERVPQPADVADALAVALTHLARTRMQTAATAGSPAATALAEAQRAAARSETNGWEARLVARGLMPGGGR